MQVLVGKRRMERRDKEVVASLPLSTTHCFLLLLRKRLPSKQGKIEQKW